MATVDKNFRIKHGLVVEGTTGTINGNNILTESSGDSYILNLVGGATLIKSVDTVFSVDNSGNLTIGLGTGLTKSMMSDQIIIDRLTTDSWYDAAGAATTAYNDAVDYVNNALPGYSYPLELNTNSNNVNLRTDGSTLKFVTDGMEPSKSNLKVNVATNGGIKVDFMNGLEVDYTAVESQLVSDGFATTTDISDAISSFGTQTNTDIQDAITTAENYADSLASNYDSYGSASQALTDANTYTDNKVSDLVNGAPALLDTLGELATALDNNPDIISNLQSVASGKQDTLTAGEGIYIDGSNVITGRQQSGGGLKFVFNEAAIDRNTVDGWYDASGAASAAEQNAKDYADSLASNYDPAGYAQGAYDDAVADANSYTDTAIGNIAGAVSQIDGAGITPNNVTINSVANQYAMVTTGINVADGAASVFGISASTYRTVKALVKAKNGVHTQVSEILLTLDTSNNVAITEYAMVGTNGSLGDVSAIYHASGNIFVLFTPVYDNTDVMVYATALI